LVVAALHPGRAVRHLDRLEADRRQCGERPVVLAAQERDLLLEAEPREQGGVAPVVGHPKTAAGTGTASPAAPSSERAGSYPERSSRSSPRRARRTRSRERATAVASRCVPDG